LSFGNNRMKLPKRMTQLVTRLLKLKHGQRNQMTTTRMKMILMMTMQKKIKEKICEDR